MNRHKGLYCIVQYSPESERMEFVNIGVVVIVPELKLARSKFTNSSSRVKRLFGHSISQSYFKSVTSAFSDRLNFEAKSRLFSASSFESFSNARANEIRMSPMRSILVNDPEATLNDLFEQLVESSFEYSAPHEVSKSTLDLGAIFAQGNVTQFLDVPEPVSLPHGVKISAKYAYQNGAYNLIEAIRVSAKPHLAMREVGNKRYVGEWLDKYSEGGKRLVLVSDMSNLEPSLADDLNSGLKEAKIKSYDINNIEPLLEDIRENFAAHN
jgi:Protein of unknown function (DUF3037)